MPAISRSRLSLTAFIRPNLMFWPSLLAITALSLIRSARRTRCGCRRKPTNAQEEISDPDNSAAVRRFHRSGILQYGFVIYNAQLDKATNRPQLTTQVRLFREGQPIFVGKEIPFSAENQTDLQRLNSGGAIQ